MAKFLITLNLKNSLQRVVEEVDEDAATWKAYDEAKDMELAIIGDGWQEPMEVEVLEVEELA